MKKYFQTAALLFIISFAHAQKLSLNHGKIEFYTETVLSDIEAVTEKFDASLDVQTGIFEVKVRIETFEFEYETMQEHFNDDYMESAKFPVATFRGKISQDISNISGELKTDANGEMTIHGVTRNISVKADISEKDGLVVVKCKIPVVFKDYNVDEPSILSKPVAKDVVVKGELYLN